MDCERRIVNTPTKEKKT